MCVYQRCDSWNIIILAEMQMFFLVPSAKIIRMQQKNLFFFPKICALSNLGQSLHSMRRVNPCKFVCVWCDGGVRADWRLFSPALPAPSICPSPVQTHKERSKINTLEEWLEGLYLWRRMIWLRELFISKKELRPALVSPEDRNNSFSLSLLILGACRNAIPNI